MSAAVIQSRLKLVSPSPRPFLFPPFRLDPAERCLWRGVERLSLTPKSFAVLLHLVQNAARPVSKEELMDAVWPATFVGDAVLKVCIAELRKALGDTTQNPLYIQTLHRLGYRFIGRLEALETMQAAPLERERALDELRTALKTAASGRPRIVFVTGEAGIGKTLLVETFLREARLERTVRVAQAHCLDQYGPGEPYFALLEALGSLTAQMDRGLLGELLKQHAPTWLAEMPFLVQGADREWLSRETIGAAQGRMLRELGALVEALTAEIPLILLLEDLHWSDLATVDAIAHLARHRQSSRLLLIATYRPDEAILRDHPLRTLKHDLRIHANFSELALEFLSEAAIAAHLRGRFDSCQWAGALAALIHKRTDGNPLLMVNVIDLLLSRQTIRNNGETWELRVAEGEPASDIPESVQEMVERQIACSPAEEQALLRAASIVGPEFSAAALAAALGEESDSVQVEERCLHLVRRGRWLEARPPGDDQFRFIHELYQRALRRTVPAGERIQCHRRIAAFLEEASPKGNSAELAWHWEGGRAYERAIPHLIECARLAARRHAAREALAHLERAFTLLRRSPRETVQALEGSILEQRGLVLRSMDDIPGAAAEFESLEAFARANGHRELEVRALVRLSAVLFWSDQQKCLEAAERAVELSRSLGDPDLVAQAAGYQSSRILRLRGWNDQDFGNCVRAVEAARRMHDPDFLGLHLMSLANFHSSQAQYEEACRAADEGMRVAAAAGDAYHYISCEYFKAWALLHAGRWGEALALVRDGFSASERNGHHTAATYCRLLEAWLHLEGFDSETAATLAGQALAEAPCGLVRILALIIASRAERAVDRLESAAQKLAEVRSLGTAIDWAYKFPLLQAEAELSLAEGDWQGARSVADALSALAQQSRQETYLGIAQSLRMEAALGDGAGIEAPVPLERGCHLLADWRLHHAAARLAERDGCRETAARHWELSREALQRLSQSMPAGEPLASSVHRGMALL
jgi:predicted ATPase